MRSQCTVCIDERRLAIESALLHGTSFRAVGLKFGFKKDTLYRHKTRHLVPGTMQLKHERRLIDEAADATAVVFGKLQGAIVEVETSPLESAADVMIEGRRLFRKTMTILATADQIGDSRIALRAVKEGREILEMFGRAFAMFNDGGVRVDNSTKILNLFGGMEESELRRLAAGNA